MGRQVSKKKPKKIVLAYSGGLDTSVILQWLKDRYSASVIAYTADVGQGESFERIKRKALATGADKVIVEDLRDPFLRQYAFRSLAAGARYGPYLLATALARYPIAAGMVAVARREKADAIAHGCTGKGNDQVRFEVTTAALAPDLKVLAPVREWELKTREAEIEYARKKKIPVEVTKASPYSIDRNLWGISIECGALEDPWTAPPKDAYLVTTAPEKAPARPAVVTVDFDRGLPVGLNGRAHRPAVLVDRLNVLAGKHGVGRVDTVEDRLVGIKSREIYECPAATVLDAAYRGLESLVLDRDTLSFKNGVSERYGRLVYNGLWFTPLREALDGFVETCSRWVTGSVRMELYRGTARVTGRRSAQSLYSHALATYSTGDVFDQKAAAGFVKLWGLPAAVTARRRKQKR